MEQEGKVENILEKVGLSGMEARVYLGLLKLKETQTGELCKEINIASSNIYKLLDSLIKKGLVSYRVQNNTKVFMASPPETLNELFLDRQKKLDEERKEVTELISKLKVKEVIEEPQSNYKYYEGINGVKAMWNEITSKLNKNSIERIYGGKKEAIERLIGFYEENHKVRNKLGAKAKILIANEMKALGNKRKNKNTEVKYADLKNEGEWGIVDDMVYIQYIITSTPRSFLIKDPIFAKTFELTFEALWKIAKK